MLVIDASIAIQACLSRKGFEPLGDGDLVAPPLLWSEASSVLHEMRWRDEISEELATIAMEQLTTAPIRKRGQKRLFREAWKIADDFGWAKTYDAEYVGLAHLLQCPLLTIDARLRVTASRLVKVLGPADL